MSDETSEPRINRRAALRAGAALGGGLLAAAPASAQLKAPLRSTALARAASIDAFGTVFVFNLLPGEITVTDLNGQGQVGQAIPPALVSDGWTAQSTAIPRTNLGLGQLESPLFVDADDNSSANSVTFNEGGESWRADVVIPNPPSPRLEDDLVLYLMYQWSLLLDPVTGAPIPQPKGMLGQIRRLS